MAWVSLKGCCTLGVTRFGVSRTTGPEADMALNTNFNWVDEANDSGSDSDFDAESVFLHENGHVFGADHSNVAGAVMVASYEEGRRGLSDDDKRAIAFLYPNATYVGSISGIVQSDSGQPIVGATVSIETTPVFATTVDGSDPDTSAGDFSLDGVPMIGTYDVTASAEGFASPTQTVSVSATGLTFSLAPGGDGGDGGECIPKGRFGRNCL